MQTSSPRPPRPRWLSAAYVAAGVVMTGAGLFEAGYGGYGSTLNPVSIAGALVTGLAVALCGWFPLAAIMLLAGGMGLAPLVTGDSVGLGGTQLIALMLLVGNAAYSLPRARSIAAYVLCAVVPPILLVVAGESIWEFIFFVLILGPAWVVGTLLRREQARSKELAALAEELRREREKQAEVAVAAERTRISRELHDAVAHTVSVMTLQVGVVRRRQAAGSVEEDTLRRAEDLGRQAVDELRRIVGIVREGESAELAPVPSLGLLEELVDGVRRTGTPVELSVTGDTGEVPQAVGISAYRIVQEGLTNAMRHASGAPVRVEVAVEQGQVSLAVLNGADRGPRGRSIGSPEHGGHGLAGLRERVHVLGGTLEAGPSGEGYRLAAVLPLGVAVAS